MHADANGQKRPCTYVLSSARRRDDDHGKCWPLTSKQAVHGRTVDRATRRTTQKGRCLFLFSWSHGRRAIEGRFQLCHSARRWCWSLGHDARARGFLCAPSIRRLTRVAALVHCTCTRGRLYLALSIIRWLWTLLTPNQQRQRRTALFGKKKKKKYSHRTL